MMIYLLIPILRMIKKSRRTSSDNVSTPASNRSRSPSIISTGDEHGDVLVRDGQTQEESRKSDIDKILELVHELKQKDLDEYRRRIHMKNQDKNKCNQSSSDINSKEISMSDKNINELSNDNLQLVIESLKCEKHDRKDDMINVAGDFNLEELDETIKNKIQAKEKSPNEIIRSNGQESENIPSFNLDMKMPQFLNLGNYTNLHYSISDNHVIL